MQKRVGVFLLTALLLVLLIFSSTTIVYAETALEILEQPQSATVYCGATAEVTFTAAGDDLQYKWYYKNKGASKFSLTETFTSNTYTADINESRNGRMIYCVVTDKYGNSVQTDVVTLSMVHLYDEGVLTKEATCSSEGAAVYTCQRCRAVHNEVISTTEHDMSDWEVYVQATPDKEGVERKTCKTCGYYEERSTAKLDAAFYVTVKSVKAEPYKVAVDKSGNYSLSAPEKKGYVFSGWVDEKGNAFEPKGTISADTTVEATWALEGTDTLLELLDRTDSGVDKILITADIVVDRPIYISHKTTVYSDGDYSIIRAKDYAGDIFVVGTDTSGKTAVELNRKAVLTIGGGKGMLTVDGNRDKVTVDVVGSLLYVSDSATVNVCDGVRFANNKKVGNERNFDHCTHISFSTADRAGGAGILIQGATVNMYGGIVENNLISTEYNVVENEDGTTTTYESNGCGGGVYNNGNFNMYGGVIRNNEGLRGGGFYTGSVAYLKAGTISDNLSHVYGGAISTSSAMNANLYLGTTGDGDKMIISGNRAMRAGGAIYSNTSSPIIALGNTEFINNTSDTSGGAIYTAGGLTMRDTVFKGNHCYYSGGAIYHHYTKAEFTPRKINLKNCVFEENYANLGGAVILSASDTVKDTGKGTDATITGCEFIGNKAVLDGRTSANGGALYITRSSKAVLSDCSFTVNTAATNGGAVSVHSSSDVSFANCSFSKNTATNAGAMNLAATTKVALSDIVFSENEAVLNEAGTGGNGGALYIYDADVTWSNLDFFSNSAAGNAGACYLAVTDLSIDSSFEFEGNSALGHGGAFYLTYKTLEDGTRDGAFLIAKGVEFKSNTALAGGAISIRSDCRADLTDVVLSGNTATSTGESSYGGGAVYVGYGTLNLSNVTASNNTSAFYGGAVMSVGSEVTIKNSNFSLNSAPGGGALRAVSASTVTINNSVFTENSSEYANTEYNSDIGGGAISTSSSTLTISGSTLDSNSSAYYGGAIHANKTQVTINENTKITNSKGGTGAALYFKGGSDIKISDSEVTNNRSTANGVIYINASNANITNVVANGNSAKRGGVIFASNASSQVSVGNCNWSGNTATDGGVICVTDATVVLNYITFSENTANKGGAIYNEKGSLILINASFIDNKAVKTASGASGNGGAIVFDGGKMTASGKAVFSGNTAEGHGGAIYIVSANLSVYKNFEFTDNSAGNHGGAFYLTYNTLDDGTREGSVLTAYGTKFENNSALAGGAISIRSECEANLNNLTLSGNTVEGFDGENDGDGEGGGAIYVGYGTLNLNNVILTGNKSTGFGGAIDAVGADVKIENCDLSNNEALYGGAVYAMSASNVTVDGTTFTSNKSTYDNVDYDGNKGGGAISIKGGELNISGSTFDGNGSDYYGGTILANGTTVVINGDSSFKNSIGKTGSALHFRGGCKVTLENISVIDNKNAYNGVIYANGGTLDITNVTASGNSASSGGVLYVSGSTAKVTLKNSNWSGNNASAGGAMYLANGSTEITDSVFSENTASLGGVVYIETATVNVSGCDFTLNNAVKTASGSSGHGGAIVVAGGTLTTSGNTFTENTAEGYAGAVYVSNYKDKENLTTPSNAGFTGDVFEKNSAASGGAVFVASNCTGNFDNVSFAENNASSTGGAIYTASGSSLTLKDTGFTSNSSTGNGGAIYASSAELTLSGGNTFTKNSSPSNGGAIYLSAATLNAEGNNTFSENTAAKHGGAFYLTYTSNEDGTKNPAVVTMSGGTFSGNSAMCGGAVSIRTACIASFDGTTFENNSVEGDDGKPDGNADGGGAIYVGFGTLNLNNVNLTGNKSAGFGGAVDSLESAVVIKNSAFTSNEALYGGAIYSMSASDITIEDTTFTSNMSTYDNSDYDGTKGGGAISIKNGKLNISGSTFDGNGSDYYGGTILANGTTVTINGNSVIKNSIGETGSALHFRGACNVTLENVSVIDNNGASNGVIYQNAGTLDMINVTASGNSASSGGVLYVSGATSQINVNNCTFTSNNATNGGALSLANGTTVVSGSVFSNNTATNGGAIFVSGSGAKLTVKDASQFTENSAATGGAIYNELGTVTVEGSTFLQNKALKTSSGSKGHGGAITVAGGTLTASGNTFTENTAESYAGAVYVANYVDDEDKSTPSTASFTGDVFEKNSAATGGAVYVASNCTANVDGADFVENSASSGGAVYVASNGTANIDGAGFVENSASSGGAIYTGSGSSLTLKDTSFTSNVSTGNGGAIYVSTARITLSGGNNFSKNSSSTHAGAIYLLAATLNAEGDNTFSENTAAKHGGAFYLTYTNNEDGTKNPAVVTMSGGTFTSNSALCGGAVSIRTACIASFDGTTFENNFTEGDDGTPDGDADGGGAIYAGFGTLNLSNATLKGNVSSTYGGAVDSMESAVVIKNSAFTSNEALYGGALSATTKSEVTVSDNTLFKDNTAASGGAVYLDKASVLTVSNSSFEANAATGGDGGAILIADSSSGGKNKTTLNLTNVSFKANTASSKGGAISTDSSSANLVIDAVNCTFTENKALGAGGGAVEIQNANCTTANGPSEVTIVFTNCTFKGNTAKTTGGAIEIRTSSCAKIDGIIAENNVSPQNGGVIYITSNYSRLYLTGDVTSSGNSAKSGAFACLYNNKYSNPPMIYTTHSNTASWVSQVASTDNTVRITYNLTEMP